MPGKLQFGIDTGRSVGASTTPASMIASKSLERMRLREMEFRRPNLVYLSAGLGIIAGFLSLGIACTYKFISYSNSLEVRSIDDQIRETPLQSMQGAMVFVGVVLIFSILIALLTRKESRSDVANQVMESGSHSGGDDNPLVRLILVILMLGLLYGEFLVIDCIKSSWVRFKLRGVDRYRAAAILATVLAQPVDVDTQTLLQIGEPVVHLRKVLAYLIEFEWVDISPDGRYLRLLSLACRALRH